MATAEELKSLEQTWPAVVTAYDYVLPSHQMMASRVGAMGKRISDIMTFSATITLGFPVLGQAVNKQIAFVSPPFVAAVLLFVAVMCFGIAARDMGNFAVISPARVWDRSLRLSEWEFKWVAIKMAAVCFNHNRALADRKAEYAKVMSAMVLLEVICLLVWIARAA
jgi:hypothetical protein